MANSQSTVTLQQECDILQGYGDLEPILNVAGQTSTAVLTAANNVMSAIHAVAFPHKWAEANAPLFYTNSLQQDYAAVYPNGQSLTNLSWLERGICIDINNIAQPKPYRLIETGRELSQATGSVFDASNSNSPAFLVNWIPNNVLYYGIWGQANTGTSTLGNNPVAGSVYTPLVSLGGSMPLNPIMQIQDANGNLLVLTGFGTEGSAAPVLPVNSTPGTTVSGSGATTVWTVVDPYGVGFRILPVPVQSGVTWQFNLVYQMKPVRFTSLGQTLAPFPDEFEPHFQMGLIAQLYRFSPMKAVYEKFPAAWQLWLKSLQELRSREDRETEENIFVPDRGIMGGTAGRNKFMGPAYPFNYPSR